MISVRVSLVALFLCSTSTFAQHGPIDRPYKNLVHPINDVVRAADASSGSRSNILETLRRQTPVKDQAYRGTCSIFSATALLESILIARGVPVEEADLSEEWLQYLTTQTTSEEGSTSPDNFVLIREYGQPYERSLPYGMETWTSKRKGLAAKRCGHLKRSWQLRACLVSHRDPALLTMKDEELLNPNFELYDPEFVNARREAFANRDSFLVSPSREDGIVEKVSQIREYLNRGEILTLDLDFYYGSWNHPGGRKWEIQASPRLWKKGVITYPEKGSNDRAYSKRDGGGHSVVVVGYDDNVEVSYWVKMKSGTRKKFTRRGVYYIKNSWGATDWGRDFEINGRKYPGYGMILQDHAHDFGQFFHLSL